MPSLLITQCLQNDFVERINRYDPLPNQLHIGAFESLRLLGERPEDGPLRHFMQWALHHTNMPVIHIRDWHDPDDPEQARHLSQFGPHCIQNTPGAEFVYQNDMTSDQQSNIVNASGMNDFYRTNLEELLEPYKNQKVRVGLIGVWTDAKISYLAYELMTRYQNFEIAVCDALTASSSRSLHFIALEQLKRNIGVQIIPSIGEFSSFLSNERIDLPIPKSALVDPQKLKIEDDYQPTKTDRNMLLFLFRDSTDVYLKKLSGGFSGNIILRAKSFDIYGHKQPAYVIKMGDRDLINQEKQAFERVQETLGNTAPSIVDASELQDRAAVKYRYAAMQGEQSTTFKDFYQSTNDTDRIKEILSTVFADRLGRFYDASVSEPLNLLDYYEFSPTFAPGIRKRVSQILADTNGTESATDQTNETIEIVDGVRCRHPALFYENDLTRLKGFDRREHFTSWVHGDLNGANIILDSSLNVWIIDFFHTQRGHILKDLVKLENDIFYIFTKLQDEADLRQAIRLTDHLFSYQDVAIVPDLIDGLSPSLYKALETIRHLRSYYEKLVQHDRDPYQLDCAIARYAIHTLSFDESSALQKKWALYAGARHIERIRYRLIESKGLRIDFLKTDTKADQIGITILPGRRDRHRLLADDIETIKDKGVSSILCLLSDNEFDQYGVNDLLEQYRQHQFTVMHSPIVDQSIPSFKQMDTILDFLDKAIANDEKVLIHCVGGIGRSGTVAACYLSTRHNMTAEDAIDIVRQSRSPRMIENQRQEDFCRRYTTRYNKNH